MKKTKWNGSARKVKRPYFILFLTLLVVLCAFSLAAAGGPKMEVVPVANTAELLAAIGSNREIQLQPGVYNLTEFADQEIENPVLDWNQVYNGKELVIRNIENLSLKGMGTEPSHIVVEPRFAYVINFAGTKNISIENIEAGHTPQAEGCEGGVFRFIGCQGVSINKSILYGCGTIGLDLERTQGLTMIDSVIKECTSGIMDLRDSEEIIFKKSEFYDNRDLDLINVSNCKKVRFEECRIYNNRSAYDGLALFALENSKVFINDSDIFDNDADFFAKGEMPIVRGNTDYTHNLFQKGVFFDPSLRNQESGKDEDGKKNEKSRKQKESANVDEASKRLVVYTYNGFPVGLIETIKDYFLTTYRIEVEFSFFFDTDTFCDGLIQNRIEPKPDVVIGLDNFTKADQRDLFLPYKPQAVSKIRPELFFDPQYRIIPFNYNYVVFNYERERLERIPKSHHDLLDPYYQEKIIIDHPQTSTPGKVFLLTTIALYGENGYLDYWRQLKKNLSTITWGWDEAYYMYTIGEAPIVLSYGTMPVCHLLSDKTERYQSLVLDNSAYAHIMGMGIVKDTANLKEAQQLEEYFLSPQFQSLIPESMLWYPVTKDAKLPDSFRVAAQAKQIINLPSDQVEAKLDGWLEDWEKVINR